MPARRKVHAKVMQKQCDKYKVDHTVIIVSDIPAMPPASSFAGALTDSAISEYSSSVISQLVFLRSQFIE
jgi:hypothetical protein